MTRLPLLLLLPLLACSERSFREVEVRDSDEPETPVRPPPSGWDDLEPGSGVDALLAAVWSDRDATRVDKGTFRCGVEYDRARYGFWDLEGRLIAEVTPPDPSYRPPPSERAGIERPLGLSPVGQTAFMAVSVDETGLRHAWIGDGETRTGADVMTWQGPGPGVISFADHDKVLDLGSPIADLWVHADPDSPDHVWLAPVRLDPDWESTTPLLYRVDLGDPDRLASWTAAELLRGFDRELDVDGLRPANLSVSRHDGDVVVAMDLAGERYVDGSPQLVGPGIVAVYDPARERVLWTHEVSHAPAGPAAFDIDTDGNLAWLGTAFSAVDGGLVANFDRSETRSDTLGVPAEADGRLACPATALLLDAPSGTAMFRAVIDPPEGGDGLEPGVLILTHRGERLLRIDAVTDGLSQSAFIVHDLTLIKGP